MKIIDKHKLEHNIEEIAKYDLEHNNVFGSSYLVWQNESIVFKKHFGNADVDKKTKVNDSTIYRLASMTKPVTAIAILILVDRGMISLDDPVSKYIPEFEDIHIILDDGTDLGKTNVPVTILHCLTHTSGLVGGDRNINMTENDRKSRYDTIKYYLNVGLGFEPFTKEVYNGIAAFDILAAIIEKVTKQDYGVFLKNEIFTPCNMTNTTFLPSEGQWERIITMHNKVDGENVQWAMRRGCVFEEYPCEHKLAGAGLVSDLNDYSNFAQMLLNKGEINNHRILSEDTFNKLTIPYVPKDIMSGCENWGLGVRVITDEAYKYLSVGSFGWSGAYGSHFWVDPENGIYAVYMKNSMFDGGAGNRSAQRFEQAVFDALMQ